MIYDANGNQVRRAIGFSGGYTSVPHRTDNDRVNHLSGSFVNAPENNWIAEECMKKQTPKPMPKGKGGKGKGKGC